MPALATDWVVHPEWVQAHEDFLGSTPLQGRGSATRDEAIAAAYVASEFEGYGLQKAPGLAGYLQTARIVQPRLTGTPALTAPGALPFASLALIMGSHDVRGAVSVFDGAKGQVPTTPIVVVPDPAAHLQSVLGAAESRGIQLVIVPESEATHRMSLAIGASKLPSYLEGTKPPQRMVALASLSDEDMKRVEAMQGRELSLSVPLTDQIAETTNAIGYLPGTDPNAGVLLISAHLDHLGVVNGTIMPGANDDASGTTAVLELAHAFASGERMRRGILFVCYGSEELGGFGSRYFGAHPPIPLSSIVANLEIEMIGAQDPKLPAGTMMMTGFDRSDFGEILKKNGGLVTADPYPEQHFFERSDNYSLALQGIVAHTVSGWALTPTYHRPTDTIANLDIPFMTRAIQSLIPPLRLIANGGETPHWKPGGRPIEKN
jgi:hypothetical protein